MEQSGKTSDLDSVGADETGDVGTENSNGVDSGSDRGSGNGKRPYIRRNGNGGSGHRADSGGNAGNGNADDDEIKKPVDDASVRAVKRGRKPIDKGFNFDVAGKQKFKKGYRPLLTPSQTDQLVDSSFGGAAIVIGSQWAIDETETKELSKHFYNVLELFPVKLDDNPLVLQRIFAIFGLIVALIAVCSNENRFAETLKGHNDGIIGRGKTKKTGITAGNGSGQNTVADLSGQSDFTDRQSGNGQRESFGFADSVQS